MFKQGEALGIVKEMMSEIGQTDAWIQTQLTDPRILAADDNLRRVAASTGITKAQYNAIEEAACASINAYIDAAILYGIRVAQAIQYATQNPAEYGRYVLNRMNTKEDLTA